ncbi:MAG: Flp family type IVb pilin [Endomicrobiales bacterium]
MLRKFLKDESGQGMVEYVLIVALIAVIVIAGVKLFGKQIQALFSDSTTKISSETGVSTGE